MATTDSRVANERVVEREPQWLYLTGITTADQGTIQLFNAISGVRILDAWLQGTTAGATGTHTILANLETSETTAGIILTLVSLTQVATAYHVGDSGHAAMGGILVASTDATIDLVVTVSAIGTIVTEAVFNVGVLLVRETWPATTIDL